MSQFQKNIAFLVVAGVLSGLSWVLIPSQAQHVPYALSISYRFTLAGVTLLAYVYFKKECVSLSPKAHFLIAMQGFFMYSSAHWCTYNASLLIPTGIIALMSTMAFLPNTILGSILLKDKISSQLLVGGFISIIGVVFLFWDDVLNVNNSSSLIGFLLVLTALIIVAFGTILSRKMNIRQSLAYTSGLAMLYGAAFSMSLHLIMGGQIVGAPSWDYLFSLLYISIIMTPIVFVIYLRLTHDEGINFASHIWLITATVSLNMSAFLENLTWNYMTIFGSLFVIVGSYISFRRKDVFKSK